VCLESHKGCEKDRHRLIYMYLKPSPLFLTCAGEEGRRTEHNHAMPKHTPFRTTFLAFPPRSLSTNSAQPADQHPFAGGPLSPGRPEQCRKASGNAEHHSHQCLSVKQRSSVHVQDCKARRLFGKLFKNLVGQFFIELRRRSPHLLGPLTRSTKGKQTDRSLVSPASLGLSALLSTFVFVFSF
jgi:hypothetical protein